MSSSKASRSLGTPSFLRSKRTNNESTRFHQLPGHRLVFRKPSSQQLCTKPLHWLHLLCFSFEVLACERLPVHGWNRDCITTSAWSRVVMPASKQPCQGTWLLQADCSSSSEHDRRCYMRLAPSIPADKADSALQFHLKFPQRKRDSQVFKQTDVHAPAVLWLLPSPAATTVASMPTTKKNKPM